MKNHQHYISLHLQKVTFGGLLQSEDGKNVGLCIFFLANKKEDVDDFLHGDPYYSLYSHVEVHRFSQRVPKI